MIKIKTKRFGTFLTLSMFMALSLCVNVAVAGEKGTCSYSIARIVKGKKINEAFINMRVNWELKGYLTRSVVLYSRSTMLAPYNPFTSIPELDQKSINPKVVYKDIGNYTQNYLQSFTAFTHPFIDSTRSDLGHAVLEMRFTKEEATIKGQLINIMTISVVNSGPAFLFYYVMEGSGKCTISYYTHDYNDVEHEGRIIKPVLADEVRLVNPR